MKHVLVVVFLIVAVTESSARADTKIVKFSNEFTDGTTVIASDPSVDLALVTTGLRRRRESLASYCSENPFCEPYPDITRFIYQFVRGKTRDRV